VLAAATGEDVGAVCPDHRSLPLAMAPPMASAALGRPPFTVADLVDELAWPEGTDVGLLEGVGGLRSPLADDGDTGTLIAHTDPDDVLVVADAGLGAINAVRLVADGVRDRRIVVALNRYDGDDALHCANRAWLVDRDGFRVVTTPDELAAEWA
jgi:dethiobiotin synthetase